MKRKLTLVLTVLFTLFTLPISGLTVLAEENQDKTFKDGTYEIPLNILHATEDKGSGMQGYLKESSVTITDGAVEATVVLTDADLIKGFEVAEVEAEVVVENEEANERAYLFSVNNLGEIIHGKIEVHLGSYQMTHDIRLQFDTSNIPVVTNDNAGSEDETDGDTGSEDGTDGDTGSEGETDGDTGSEDETGGDTDSGDGTDGDTDSGDGTDGDTDSGDGTDGGTDSGDGTDEDADSEEERTEVPVDPTTMKDGIYEVNYEVDYQGADFSNYFTQPAILTLKNGELYLQFEHTDSNFINGITIPNGEIDVISEDEENQTRVVGFYIDSDLSEPVDMGLEMFYGSTHDVNVNFDLDTLIVVELFADSVDPTTMKDGIYEVNYAVDYNGADFSEHFTQPALLTLEDDELYLQFEHINTNFINGITIPNGEVDVISEDEENQTRVVGFHIDTDLSKSVDMGLKMFYGANHAVKVNFDLGTLKLIEEFPINEPETPNENPKPEPTPEPVQTPEENQLVPDKAYEIDYVIMDAEGEIVSAADYFFVKPGILLEKDGTLYAQFTITEGDMVKELSNMYGPALIVERNQDGSIVVQFKVDKDLANMILNMTIDVPGVYDNREHKAILVFDKSSMSEIDGSEYTLVASNSDNGPTVEGAVDGKTLGNGGQDPGTPSKPKFGSNGSDEQKVAASNNDSTNPQTGDTSAIWLYALLLIGSFVPLAVKFKRRFV